MEFKVTQLLFLYVLLTSCTSLLSFPSAYDHMRGNVLDKSEVKSSEWHVDKSSEPELETLRNRVARLNYIDSVLIAKGDTLVFEHYQNGFGPHRLHILKSITKSLLNLILGAVLQQHPEYRLTTTLLELGVVEAGSNKAQINLQHLLSMTSGIAYGENVTEGIFEADDPLEAMLSLPVIAPAGEVFNYSSVDSHLLALAIERISGRTSEQLLQHHFLHPLGIKKFLWPKDKGGNTEGGSELYLTPRDLAKFGLLCMHQGGWKGRSLISSDWLELSTKPSYDFGDGLAYASHWFAYSDSDVTMYFAMGYGGQLLAVVPEQNIIVVITSDWRLYPQLMQKRHSTVLELLYFSIVSAVNVI